MIDKKLIERVKRLMAMAADGSSPNEAAIAARRARSLMDKHQLSIEDLVETDGFGIQAVGKTRRSVPKWEQWLCISIARYNDCIVDFDYDDTTGSMQLRFKGFQSDVEVSKFMFFYLAENGKRSCRTYAKEITDNPHIQVLRTSFKNAYARELTSRFKELVAQRKKEVLTTTGTSLMVVKKQLVEQKFGMEKYNNKGRTSERGGFDASNARYAGKQAGVNTSIHTGISSDKKQHLN